MMNKKILLDFEEILQFLKKIRIEVLAVCGPVNTPLSDSPHLSTPTSQYSDTCSWSDGEWVIILGFTTH